jgi:hypothetical protein
MSNGAHSPLPPFTPVWNVVSAVAGQGHAVVGAEDLAHASGVSLPDLMALRSHWNHLPADAYLRDGGRYRRRRHSCFVIRGNEVQGVPHRAHWQPVEYNALHGGLERWFEPMDAAMTGAPCWAELLAWLGGVCTQIEGRAAPMSSSPNDSVRWAEQPWFVEAHSFRIDTTDGIGRPTPEGAHRDGVDFVAVFLVARHGIKGGETRIFDAQGPSGLRFTLDSPWSLLLLDDARVIHETTPIQPSQAGGYRDTLVVTLRRGGFQGPA